MTAAASLTISRFTSRFSPPTRESLTWQQLAALFADPRQTPCTVATCGGSTCAHKDGECWSPAVFSSNRRSKQDAESLACLVLDVDHVPDAAIAAMRKRLVDYQHLIHVTHADRPDDRCVRVIVQLSRAVAPLEWRRFWHAAVDALSVPTDADPTCCDVARCYYLPSRPRDADYFVVVHAGEALDVDATLTSAPALQDPAAAPQEGAAP